MNKECANISAGTQQQKRSDFKNTYDLIFNSYKSFHL